MVHWLPDDWRHCRMVVVRASRVCVLVAIVGGCAIEAIAGERARMPAEIELRRDDVLRQLDMIAREMAELAAQQTHLLNRLAGAMPAEAAALAGDAERLRAAALALDEEAAVLRTEYADLAAIRTRSVSGPLLQGDPQGLGVLDLATSGDQVTSARAFNPSIAIIPDINYFTDNRRGRGFVLSRQADGFAVSGDDDPATTDPARGFNLRELEAAFMGTIDPYFDVWSTVVIQGDSIAVEEAYVQTRRFLPGLQLRVGRFLSGLGYINRQHPHQWDFFDQALPYEALLGGGIADTGVQLTWLPPLPVYTLFGVEALQGDTPRIVHRAVDDFPDMFEEKAGPRLLTGFFRLSPDVGYSSALQIGASAARSRGHQEALEEDGVLLDGLEGEAWVAGTDVVWRYESGRAYGRGNVTVQGEYLYRRLRMTPRVSGGITVSGVPDHRSTQDGAYAQVVYGIAARWTVGGRVDVIGLRNRIDTGDGPVSFDASSRLTGNATFNPTEFSRIRAQYSHGRLRSGGAIVPVHQVAVQFQMSLGAHGAHRF